MILALLFEAETPFSQIRSGVYQMVRKINSPAGIIRGTASNQTITPAISQRASIPQTRLTDIRQHDEVDEKAILKPLLENVPAPMPVQEDKRPNEINVGNYSGENVNSPAGSGTKQDHKTEQVEAQLPEARQQASLPVIFDLSYFCALIPRMPHHKLTGDLASQLSLWVGQLCMAYGWRLEHLSIQPDYIQWVVNIIPSVVPDSMMEILRKQTSERIFSSFPQLGRDNPSGDFWAPGYLISTRMEQPSDQMIQEFIYLVRQYQGASSTKY
jgi:REP element-mobilizing transposase RayT